MDAIFVKKKIFDDQVDYAVDILGILGRDLQFGPNGRGDSGIRPSFHDLARCTGNGNGMKLGGSSHFP